MRIAKSVAMKKEANRHARAAREMLRAIRIEQRAELVPGQVEEAVKRAWLAGYRYSERRKS